MSEQIEITIKIPVSYFEKLRLESTAIDDTVSDVATAATTASGETVVVAKNEFMNIINQLPDMVKNMLPKDLEKMSKDEQKTFVITLTKNYPQMKEMVSEKMINDLSSYFQCKAAELGFVKKFKYQQPSDSPAPTPTPAAPTTPTPAVPQMQDMFAGLMGMMKPPAPLKEGETPPPQPSMQDFLAGFMGMMQQNAAAATTAASVTTTAASAATATSVSGAATSVASIEEAD
jgi:hypothetical protein